jgi:hypothetical protein
MRRETQNVLLILLGGALLKLAFTGEFARYVKPAHQPWLIGAGAVILVLGALAVWRDLRSGGPEAEGGHEEHGHSHSTRTSWILLAPVLTVLLVAPPALGSASVSRAESRR